MFDTIRLQDLPPYAKLFVGMFVALMLCVCLWAMFIFYVEKGIVDDDNLPDYMSEDTEQETTLEDIEEMAEDPEAVTPPIWDSEHAGEQYSVDSLAELAAFEENELAEQESQEHLSHNVGLAHTHINGQTLLYFALGLVFLFTSASARVKRVVFWLFGVAVVAHAIGLTGEGFGWVYDDILAVSGVGILVIIVYMALLIFVDLGKKPVS